MNLLSNLSGSMKGVALVMGMMLPIVAMAAMSNPKMLIWFMAIYVILGIVATLIALVVEKKKKKKAAGFSENVKENASSSAGVRDPDKMLMQDDMRKEFERGIKLYKDYGKDLYSLPWFVVVGESGSGKTEAIRRSEIGFPDKLQQFWQGSGGTMSMHWWFTNHSVILDTAGRLFVKDGERGDDGDDGDHWKDFLRMLSKNRPDCPINGLCLVIPATSLIPSKDSASEASSLQSIDQKAGQIAKQMEVLQSELGIRFPVYVLITKTDKLLGFREFFEHVDSPEERYQMLGWSNPGKLSDRFDPKAVGAHITEMAERLRKRRMALLKDPVPESAMNKRMAEVDAMYALPDSLKGTVPKLERYLSHIFGVNEWSPKPPFLRGIFFSSALQQGAVLDEALSSALGMTAEEYEQSSRTGDDLSLAKNRSYFLRDLFLDKIFQEKGLIIRNGKSVGKLRGWKLWLPAVLVTSLLIVAGLGWLTNENKESKELEAWRYLDNDAYKSDGEGFYTIIESYDKDVVGDDLGEKKRIWKFIKKPIKASEILNKLSRLGSSDLKSSPDLGWIFSPLSSMDGDVQDDRESAYKAAVDGVILSKLVEASILSIERRSELWQGQGVSKLDKSVLKVLLKSFNKKIEKKDDTGTGLELDLRALFKVNGIILRSSGSGYNEKTEPLVNSVLSAYPRGVIPESAYSKKDKERLRGVIEKLFKGGSDANLLTLLVNFDSSWKKLNSIEVSSSPEAREEVEIELDKLNEAYVKLKVSDKRLYDMGKGAKGGDENEDEEVSGDSPKDYGSSLLREHDVSLMKLGGPDQVKEWEESLSNEDSDDEGADQLNELLGLYASGNKNELQYEKYNAIVKEAIKINKQLTDVKEFKQVGGFIEKVSGLKQRAKDLGAEEVVSKMISYALIDLMKGEYVNEVSSPLVFDEFSGVQNNQPLTTNQAAAMARLTLYLSDESKVCKDKLLGISKMIPFLFDKDKLLKAIVEPVEWQMIIDNKGDWSGPEKFRFKMNEELTMERSEANEKKALLLTANTAAEITFLHNLEWKEMKNGKKAGWAPIEWMVEQMSRNGEPVIIGTLPAKNGSDHVFSISVSKKKGFFENVNDLPKTPNFDK